MRDQDCVRFLQLCLPRVGLRWAGYRRVRRTVCKRLRRRLGQLGLGDLDAYREHLAHAPEGSRKTCQWPKSVFSTQYPYGVSVRE